MKKLITILLLLLLGMSTALAEGDVLLGEARSDALLADYEGAWYAAAMDMAGMKLPMEEMGMTMQLTIVDGKALIMEGEGEEATTTEGLVQVQNGALTMTAQTGETIAMMQLYKNGTLVMTLDQGDGTAFSVYFEKLQ